MQSPVNIGKFLNLHRVASTNSRTNSKPPLSEMKVQNLVSPQSQTLCKSILGNKTTQSQIKAKVIRQVLSSLPQHRPTKQELNEPQALTRNINLAKQPLHIDSGTVRSQTSNRNDNFQIKYKAKKISHTLNSSIAAEQDNYVKILDSKLNSNEEISIQPHPKYYIKRPMSHLGYTNPSLSRGNRDNTQSTPFNKTLTSLKTELNQITLSRPFKNKLSEYDSFSKQILTNPRRHNNTVTYQSPSMRKEFIMAMAPSNRYRLKCPKSQAYQIQKLTDTMAQLANKPIWINSQQTVQNQIAENTSSQVEKPADLLVQEDEALKKEHVVVPHNLSFKQVKSGNIKFSNFAQAANLTTTGAQPYLMTEEDFMKFWTSSQLESPPSLEEQVIVLLQSMYPDHESINRKIIQLKNALPKKNTLVRENSDENVGHKNIERNSSSQLLQLLNEAQDQIEQNKNKQTLSLSDDTIKHISYFKVTLPDGSQDLKKADEHYVKLLKCLYERHFQHKKDFLLKTKVEQMTELQKFQEKLLMACKFGVPLKFPKGKDLVSKVTNKLAEKNNPKPQYSDTSSDELGEEKRNLFNKLMGFKMDQRFQQKRFECLKARYPNYCESEFSPVNTDVVKVEEAVKKSPLAQLLKFKA